jgi:hypothetical protein
VKEDEMGRACSTNEAKRNAYRILVGNPERKRQLGRPRRWWVDNIKTCLKWIGRGGRDSIDLSQDRDPVEGSFEHVIEPSGSIKCWEILE